MQLFNKFKSFYRDNRQYNGFGMTLFFGCLTLFILALNIMRLSTDIVDWCVFSLWLSMTTIEVMTWQHNKRFSQLIERITSRVKGLLDQEYKLFEKAADDCAEEHMRLVAANRRRKRAERKLKKAVVALRKESAVRLGFEVKCDEYEQLLLDACVAMKAEDSALVVREAQTRFNKYMNVHHAEIFRRQLLRSVVKDAEELLFLCDVNKPNYEGFAGLIKEPPSEEIKENQ